MIKLYTTKIYYLGGLSDEQYFEALKLFNIRTLFRANHVFYDLDSFKATNLRKRLYSDITALTLLDSNERIVEIQVRIQELNNELIELDNEMRELTYG